MCDKYWADVEEKTVCLLVVRRTSGEVIKVYIAMDFDMISSLKLEELKHYLKVRDLKTSGRKSELVARVFVANEYNMPLIQSAVEIEMDLHRETEKN